MKKDHFNVFSSIVRASFLGQAYLFSGVSYRLAPTLLGKYEVIRSIGNPANELERLVKALPSAFKSVAKTELYRKKGGWIEQAAKSRQFREVKCRRETFVIPYLGESSVGIDTTAENKWTYLCIACFSDSEAGYVYLDSHLKLPKTGEPKELKWRNLNARYRQLLLANFDILVRICCKAILVIKTNSLASPVEKRSDIFIKLIDGAFSGYEKTDGKRRSELREVFFSLINGIPVHCDADFAPLTTDKIVRLLVKTLADLKEFTPLHVELRSEESHPIQVADLICGPLKVLIKERKHNKIGMQQIPYNNKLKSNSRGVPKDAKVFCWINNEATLAPSAV